MTNLGVSPACAIGADLLLAAAAASAAVAVAAAYLLWLNRHSAT